MANTRQSTTGKGLGWRHRQARESLLRAHIDGSPCQWCGRPMYLDRTLNYDYNPNSTNPGSGKLHADHGTTSRADAVRTGTPIPPPDRLLHGACNIQRGSGGNDHLAAASKPSDSASDLLIAWPW